MKRNFLNTFFFALLAVSVVFTSCKNDDEETPAPTIKINTNSLGADQTMGSASAGSTVTINLSANASENIKSITVTKTVGGSSSTLGGYPISSGFDSKTAHTWNVNYTVVEASGEVTLNFRVTDEKGKEASVSFKIMVAPIKTYTTILLNNQSNSNQSSFYSVTQNTVYNNLADAKTNSDKVEFIHILRNFTEGGRKIVSPNSPDALAIYSADATNPNRVETWPTRNATLFKVIALSEADFNAISSETQLLNLAGATDTFVNNNVGTLDSGSSFAFLLANGKRGIARVTAVAGPAAFVTGGANAGSITLTVKSQN